MQQAQTTLIRKIDYINMIRSQTKTECSSLDKSIEAVIKGKLRLIGDSFTLQYFAAKHCLTVDGEYTSSHYAMLLQKDAVYQPFLMKQLHKLIVKRELIPIIKK